MTPLTLPALLVLLTLTAVLAAVTIAGGLWLAFILAPEDR